ncbi:MAG: hypothetical protein K8H88_06130 [Sandaracinaceae bacterium]|nr:hypothetical protein [Sandaracinaceae bacterium]
MGDFANTLTAAFIGATAAIFVGEWAKRWFVRRLAATDLARDGLIDTLLSIRSIEMVLASLVAAEIDPPKTRSSLVSSPSAWTIVPPVLKCERMLDGLDHEDTHADAIVFFDQLSAFMLANAEHEKAYFWLLDSDAAGDSFDAKDARVQERLGTLRVTRVRMQQYALGALRYGYELASRLAKLGERNTTIRFERESIDTLLRRRFQLDCQGLDMRAAYYRNARVSCPYRADASYAPTQVVSDDVPDRFRYCAATWALPGGSTCEVVIDLRTALTIALPTKARVTDARLQDSVTAQWIDIPARAIGLSKDDARPHTRLLRLDPECSKLRVPDDELEDEAADLRRNSDRRSDR